MGQPYLKLQGQLMREYYRDFSKYAKGRPPERKVAWVTSFAPVEILEALGIEAVYPESYAAVIAASGKEQEFLRESERRGLCPDCCSYSACFNGSLALGAGPRGTPPMPDVLIAANNQCNTLPGWWNLLSEELGVPLIVIDYPGEGADRDAARRYVAGQHEDLAARLGELCGSRLDEGRLAEAISNSRASVSSWERVAGLLAKKEIEPTALFDGISYLVTSRCKPDTARFYDAMYESFSTAPDADGSKTPVFWLGYPLWHHPDRYLREMLGGCRVCGSNYITWWSLDYAGDDPLEQLFNAYNYTFLNLSPETKRERLGECIRRSGAAAAVSLRNKSCKCDFASAMCAGIPQAEVEIDMIDREYMDEGRAKRQIGTLRELL